MSNITRYFHAKNCLRKNIPKFEPYGMLGGNWCGVRAVSEIKDIEEMLALAEDKKNAIREIAEADYLRMTKQKPVAAAKTEVTIKSATDGEPVESPEIALNVAAIPDQPASESNDSQPKVDEPQTQGRRRKQPKAE